IFVNRRGTPEERRQAIADAVEQLVRAGVDLAIYPQGTRAPGRRDANGERMDAGYFTAGGARRLATIGGHVRKGAAHLAVLAAKRLAEEPIPKPLYVVPIALLGTATALPKGSVRVQTATEIRVVIGEPRRIAMGGDPNALINAVHAGIDGQLEQGLGLRAQLATRCLRDIHRFLSADVVETVAGLLRRWSAAGAAPAGDAGGGLGDDRLVFAILDLIYTHPPARWQPWLRRLAESLHQGEPREVLEALYREVIQGL
ncbi:MAG: hypothetical protein HY543_01370, partial [Deltaproteobacteria bacterium]|nr:hypothetical protein [Deltaproteobacteria bacterium]